MRTRLRRADIDALAMAKMQRGAKKLVGLITHCDAGLQFTSVRFPEALQGIGALPSVGTIADSLYNALAKTVNSLW